MTSVLRVVGTLAAVGLALAGGARADARLDARVENSALVGVGVGSAEYVVFEDPGYSGLQLSAFAGLRISAHGHLVLRVSHYGGVQDDSFEAYDHDHSHWRVVPAVRLGSRYVWGELGLGVARDSKTRSDIMITEDDTMPTLGAIFGFSPAPRAWPVRPHVETGFGLGPGLTASIGLAVVYQPRNR
ncbi:MAG TPA: hypothetical protein VM261_18235 [Kofleriaceae bacterium]|nr:hypothetical protein [Kofleriaceae bacterium]